jgi:hypothetical protein
MHFGPNPGPLKPQYSTLIRVTRGKSHNLKGFLGRMATGYCGSATIAVSISTPKLQFPPILKKANPPALGA